MVIIPGLAVRSCTIAPAEALRLVTATLTVVHAERDQISSYAYAAALTSEHGGCLVVLPDAPHSWPVGDSDRFVAFVEDLLRLG